ncbi:hypothetical protein M747DRAFT_15799 [Aspergillus niger ATCC 13496]|uniref:Uncharacterized protein n=1 Tax=Aspergillus niger ATCC 13496 TaxID=1353008 RepID=A0A370C7H6_ASPNG|nr:hypothetical protein M747DRAFT_15799 [Aspergillus niger ATCC 13496]
MHLLTTFYSNPKNCFLDELADTRERIRHGRSHSRPMRLARVVQQPRRSFTLIATSKTICYITLSFLSLLFIISRYAELGNRRYSSRDVGGLFSCKRGFL